jgi:2-C-methyl-D-erythritol 2,4-cyclodiphosphate synthase
VIRIGTGYDLHRLTSERPLILAGVKVPYEKGLAGHSDADVLAHAVTDALLGAAAMGNIGLLFPDTDPAYKNADSLALLRRAHEHIRQAGYEVVNVDATIVAQAPKLNPYTEAMRSNLAAALDLPVERISVKPKTNEGVGPEGRGEAISAQAVALIECAS